MAAAHSLWYTVEKLLQTGRTAAGGIMDKRFESRREQLTGTLRGLYESLGYARFSMRRFEEYALYLENKSF